VGDTASAPAIAGDRVVLGTTDGRVCAFSMSDGSLLWGFRSGKSVSDLSPYARGGSDVTASAVIRDDTVYVGGSDGVFYALSLATGRKLWSHAVGVPIATAAVAAEGGVFAASYDGALYRFQ
jgi:outer membrane protein assembly factor BamB